MTYYTNKINKVDLLKEANALREQQRVLAILLILAVFLGILL